MAIARLPVGFRRDNFDGRVRPKSPNETVTQAARRRTAAAALAAAPGPQLTLE
jgi:hypothetical protein